RCVAFILRISGTHEESALTPSWTNLFLFSVVTPDHDNLRPGLIPKNWLRLNVVPPLRPLWRGLCDRVIADITVLRAGGPIARDLMPQRLALPNRPTLNSGLRRAAIFRIVSYRHWR